MSLDAFGNYVCLVTATGIEFPPIISVGHGPPDNANGENGDFYFDLDSKITYIKEGDVWNVVSGSITVSGGGGTASGAIDPEGNTTAVVGTIYTNTVSNPVTVWVKTSGSGNTGWTQIA